MAFVRSSKFRHVFGTAWKREKCYDNIRITKSPHDSNMCSVNGKFVAVVLESQGGGAFIVAPLSKVGRFDINYPKVAGHKGLVMDLAWNPFNDNEIASSSEDCTVKLWEIPDEGISENLIDCTVDLKAHTRKVGQILWHPSAENVLASVGYDYKIIIWNTSTSEQLCVLDEFHADIIYSISWNYNGSLLATTCKDKKIRVIDPRKNEVISEGSSHAGTKPSRVVFCGSTNKLFTTGFTRNSERQYGVWDAGNLGSALHMENIDTGSGVLFPFWDEGTKMVYIAGKGDSTIRYFEITDKSPYSFFLSMYLSNSPQRGLGCMPKREMDYMQCEVMRFYKLHPKGLVEPTSMTVPRKSDMFQEDIFPPCFSPVPAHSAEDWIGGADRDPLLIAFSSDGFSDLDPTKSQKSKPLTRKAPVKQVSVEKKVVAVSAERPPLVNRMASDSGSRDSSSPPRGPEPHTLDEYRKAYQELVKENEQLKAKIAELQGKGSHKHY